MCGIFGYTGARDAGKTVIDGLKQLEYRGYDSAGYALIDDINHKIDIVKNSGRVEKLEMPPYAAKISIGHTRWATHGSPNAVNAHPHLSFDGKFAVVHNGIIENEAEIRAELKEKGITSVSETDSELISHLLALNYKGNVLEAVNETVQKLRGAYTFLVVSVYDDAIYGCRQNASLILGLGKDENFVASDMVALFPYTEEGIILEDDEIFELKKNVYKIYRNNRPVDKKIFKIVSNGLCNNCDSFMQKEIEEIPNALLATAGSLTAPEGLEKIPESVIRNIDSVYISACGTAYHAGLYGKDAIERAARLPVEVQIASEVRCHTMFFNPRKLAIFISQSGETSDTLSALKIAKSMGSYTLAITNVRGSSITFLADFCLYLDAGAEIAVAATKSYNSQLLALYFLSRYLAVKRGMLKEENMTETVQKTKYLAVLARKLICSDEAERYAEKYYKNYAPFYIGKGIDYPTALEGALKLKEITYKMTDAYPAGELKHGTIALIDNRSLAIVIATSRVENLKIKNSVKELTARGADILLISSDDYDGYNQIKLDSAVDDLLKPVLSVIPLQKLALASARLLGLDADKPRNLAKSVTVE